MKIWQPYPVRIWNIPNRSAGNSTVLLPDVVKWFGFIFALLFALQKQALF